MVHGLAPTRDLILQCVCRTSLLVDGLAFSQSQMLSSKRAVDKTKSKKKSATVAEDLKAAGEH